MGWSGVGEPRRGRRDRQEAYADYVWRPGDPRPRLYDREDVRALADTSSRWDFVPAGTEFGEFTVLGYAYFVSKGGRPYGWHPFCRCACGWEGCVLKENLKAGRSTRCDACAKRKSSDKRWWKYKDAMPNDNHRARLLNRLSAIISRCTSPTCRVYASYGGRGIKVYEKWREDRWAFLRYVQTLPGWDNPDLQLDRTDNEKGYFPGNLRFVTCSENARNRN